MFNAMFHKRIAVLFGMLSVVGTHGLFAAIDTAYLSTVLSTTAQKVAAGKRCQFLRAERIVKDLNKFEAPTSKVIFRQHVARASDTLRDNNVLSGGRLSMDVVSKELANLGLVLRRTREYVDWAYKQHLVDQVVSLPDSEAKKVLLLAAEDMPLQGSKRDLLENLGMLPDDLVCKQEAMELARDLSEWCEGKDALPDTQEIKATFNKLSDHFYGSRALRVAKVVLKSKLFWAATVSLILFNPWYGLFPGVFFHTFTQEEVNALKKKIDEKQKKTLAKDGNAQPDEVMALCVGNFPDSRKVQTFRRGNLTSILKGKKKREGDGASSVGCEKTDPKLPQAGDLRWNTVPEFLGMEEIAQKFKTIAESFKTTGEGLMGELKEAIQYTKNLRIKAVVDDPVNSGWLSAAIAGSRLEFYEKGEDEAGVRKFVGSREGNMIAKAWALSRAAEGAPKEKARQELIQAFFIDQQADFKDRKKKAGNDLKKPADAIASAVRSIAQILNPGGK